MTSRPLELFYSYSHKDEELRDDLEEHLAMLKREGVITGWHDRRISGGREWEGQIDKHLNSADIILLLTSSAFLASDYCYDVEVTRAMERHEQEEARVIPVILRACDWHSAPFGKLQALPQDGKPIKQWPDPDVAFLDIANGIRRVAKEMKTTKIKTAEEETEPESIKPDPYLLIPNLRVSFVPRQDAGGNDVVKLLQDELSPQRPRLVALWVQEVWGRQRSLRRLCGI
jgi:TIR domain-containing protein